MSDFEEWAPVEDFELYLVSSRGHIRHTSRDVNRTIRTNAKGFPTIALYREGEGARYLRQINVLVARAFLGPPEDPSLNSIWHIDGDLTNCHVANLRWDTRSRVLEWNEMHRTGEPKYKTPKVKDNQTGRVYNDVFDCAINVGEVESKILWMIERRHYGMFSDEAEFRYVTPSEPA